MQILRFTLASSLLATIPACAQQPTATAVTPGCWMRDAKSEVALRASAFDSTSLALQSGEVKVCYSRPRMMGRPIMGTGLSLGLPAVAPYRGYRTAAFSTTGSSMIPKSGNRLLEKHALGLDPRDHAQSRD